MIRFIILSALLTGLIAQKTGPAPVISNNVPGTAYVASLTAGPGHINGSIQVSASSNGAGVTVDISWNGFNLTESNEYSKESF